MKSGKTNIAYKKIKEKILQWELSPLTDLSEEKLQEELNISRTPIREAILQLKKEGFVYIYPRKGTIVTEVNRDLIDMIYQARLLNEPFIAVKASKNIDVVLLQEIRDKLVNFPTELDKHEEREYFINLDLKLHSMILQNCNNRFLQNMMKNVYDHSQRIRMKIANPRDSYDRSIKEHIDIIDAILKNDEKLIETVSLKHIKTARKNTYRGFITSI